MSIIPDRSPGLNDTQPPNHHAGDCAHISHNHAARRQQARQRNRDAHAHAPQGVTLRLNGQPATVDALTRYIRAQDALMRRNGLGMFQRSYVHSGAMADIYRHCRTDADYQLYQEAYAQVIKDGTVLLAEDVLLSGSQDRGRCLTPRERVNLAFESARIGREGVTNGP